MKRAEAAGDYEVTFLSRLLEMSREKEDKVHNFISLLQSSFILISVKRATLTRSICHNAQIT